MTSEDRKELAEMILGISTLLEEINETKEEIELATLDIALGKLCEDFFDEFIMRFDAIEFEDKLEGLLSYVRQITAIKRELSNETL